jgi:hypothetical protein
MAIKCKQHMDYSSPVSIMKSGARAFNQGLTKSECPISSRTHANASRWWRDGWDKEAARTCAGENCNAKRRGVGHSDECNKNHSEAVGAVEIFPGTNEALCKLTIVNAK